jgi:hypothetical protein
VLIAIVFLKNVKIASQQNCVLTVLGMNVVAGIQTCENPDFTRPKLKITENKFGRNLE